MYMYSSGSAAYIALMKAVMPNLTSCSTGDYCNNFNVPAEVAGTTSSKAATPTTAAASPMASNIKSDGVAPFGMASFVGAALMYAAENLMF